MIQEAAQPRPAVWSGDGPVGDVVPDEVVRVLSVLPSASMVLGSDGTVLRASARALALGLVRRDRISVRDIRELAWAVRRDGVAREEEMQVPRPPLGRGRLDLRVRAATLGTGAVLVLVDDLSDERRVDAVRRDFVANVSHELKTPVGALALLAEAVMSASDDPEAVRRFAERMQVEAVRLSALVNDVIDLSRLQGDDPLSHATVLSVADLVTEAVDELRTLAAAHDVELRTAWSEQLWVYGDRPQLLMALRNLLSNAVAYSPAHTRVAVAVRLADGDVVIDVKDQGIGIPAADQDRIFERFYRVDPARSRHTGGTGLGLAIVKHVCRNHGGECSVWSELGEGSTFTLRLPAHPAPDPEHDPDADADPAVDAGMHTEGEDAS